jgi:hypothetical protein
VLRRTPHLDFDPDGPLDPDSRVRVRVYADRKAARADEESDDIVIALPPHLERIELDTHLLVSHQLEVIGPAVRKLVIETARDASSDAIFQVQVRSRDEILALARDLPTVDRASVSAVFNYFGRPSGRVTRVVELALDSRNPIPLNVQERIAIAALSVEVDAQRPDLLVHVHAQQINNGRQFKCLVSTPLIDAAEGEHWEDWNLPDVAETIVRGYMESFVDDAASELDRLSSLKGAGLELFDAAPASFRRLYWKLVDAGHAPQTIAVVSDEPYIPWELMIPHRRLGGRSDIREPLGVACAIGRWLPRDGCSAPQLLVLKDSIVIAPDYTDSDDVNPLPNADKEAKFVLDRFPGIRVQPATLERIESVFECGGASLLHIACHGADDANSPAQAVYLEQGRKLDTTRLAGLDSIRTALERRHTLVVINACEVGRPTPALVGLGGFAQTFIDLGAGAVVAALWSVRDDLAHEIAKEFYHAVIENPHRPFAEVFQEVRKRAYERTADPAADAKDTYAAYCFYGDPLARAKP